MWARPVGRNTRWHKAFVDDPYDPFSRITLDCPSCLGMEDREIDIVHVAKPESDLCKICVKRGTLHD